MPGAHSQRSSIAQKYAAARCQDLAVDGKPMRAISFKESTFAWSSGLNNVIDNILDLTSYHAAINQHVINPSLVTNIGEKILYGGEREMLR